MELKELKKVIPHKWRVQSTNEYGSQCVAYVDARDVQDLLDDVCEPQNWQVLYEENKGNLFAKIGIKIGPEWIWKSDCGTESNIEKQKGESSDAFKRAAVMWGVGRFLYSKKILKIKEVVKVGNKFHPAKNGKRIWDVNKYCNDMINQPIPTPKLEKEEKKPKLDAKGLDFLTERGTIEHIEDAYKFRDITPAQKLLLDKKLTQLNAIGGGSN